MTTCSATNSCGTGLGTVTIPSDPDFYIAIAAVAGFNGIDVSWSYPTTNPHAVAYFQIWRNVTESFAGAVQIARISGSHYFDFNQDDLPLTRYYWVQVVSVNGTTGPAVGPASATAKTTVAAMIEQLSGEIDAGVLAQSLKATLDKIVLNEQAITQEITARTGANNAFSQLLTQVQAGVASLYSTVQTEITSRQDGDSTLASAINTAQSSFGTSLATAQQTLQTNINTVNGKVTDIGARYTVTVGVNGLAGGFGIYNNGTTIEAGFDVSKFWVGSTNANKRKPFIIVDGTTYIDTAAIRDASIDQAKIGDLSANKITTGSLSASRINGQGLIVYSGNYTSSYSWPWAAGGTSGFHLGPSGLLMGDYYNNRYFQIDASGNVYAPGFYMTNGNLTLNNVTITRSTRVAGGSHSIPSGLTCSDSGEGYWTAGYTAVALGFQNGAGEFYIDTGYDDVWAISDTTRPVYTCKVLPSTGYYWYGGGGPGNAKTNDWAIEGHVISDLDFYRTGASGAVPGGRLFIRVRVHGPRNNHSSIYQQRLDSVTWSMNKVT
jgi:hypothetical protein